MVARQQINLKITILAVILAGMALPSVIYRLVNNIIVARGSAADGAFQGRAAGWSEGFYTLSTLTHQFTLVSLVILGVFMWASRLDQRWAGADAWIPLLIALASAVVALPVIIFVGFFHFLPSILVVVSALLVVAAGMFERAHPRLPMAVTRR